MEILALVDQNLPHKKKSSRAGKNNKLSFLWPKWPFGTPFLIQNPPERIYVGPFLRSFPGNEEHNFLGGPKWGVLGGGQKVYVVKVYVLFRSPNQKEFTDELLKERRFCPKW